MNRRDFLKTIAGAVAAVAAAPVVLKAAADKHLLDGLIVHCSGIRETCYRIRAGADGEMLTSGPDGPQWTRPQTETSFYSYDTDLVYAVAEDVKGVHRIWADGVVIYGDGAVAPFDVRFTDLNGVRLAAFDNFPLEPFGNRVPHFRFEVS